MGYKVPEQISYMRKMLNEANLKYREVNKGNEELKAKLELQAGKANEIEVTLVQEIQYLVERYDSNSLNLSHERSHRNQFSVTRTEKNKRRKAGFCSRNI
jgi:hypothetical protein